MSPRSIFLTWNPPLAILQNGVIREYHVNITEVETGYVLYYVIGSTEIEITNLHPYYYYELSVSAYTIALGPFSEHYSIRTMEDGTLIIFILQNSLLLCSTVPSGPPQNVISESNSSRSIYVHWDPPPVEQHNGIITEYIVNITPINGEETLQFYTAHLFLDVVGLLPHTTYECTVAAMTSVGAGLFSAISTVQTYEEGNKTLYFSL